MFSLGRLLLDKGEYAQADAIYQRIAENESGSLLGRLGRAEALTGMGRLKDARLQLEGIEKALRQSAAVRVTGARLALAWGKPRETLALLSPLMKAGTRDARVVALYGDAEYAAGKVDNAAASYNRALRIDSRLPEALLGRAEVFVRAERPAEALEVLQQAEKALAGRVRPPETRARLLTLFGRAHIQVADGGTCRKAAEVLATAVQIHGVPAEAFFWLGESQAGVQTTDARNAYERYLQLEPNGRYAERARRALAPRDNSTVIAYRR
jgi:tetratricopeptide (TPR) repeat protein